MFQISEVVLVKTGMSKGKRGTILYQAEKHHLSSHNRWAVRTDPNKLKLINENNLEKIDRKAYNLNNHLIGEEDE